MGLLCPASGLFVLEGGEIMNRDIGYTKNDVVFFNLLVVFFLIVVATVLLYAPVMGSFDMFIPLACMMLNVIVAYTFGLQRGMLLSIVFTFIYGSYVIYDARALAGVGDVNFAHVLWMMFFPLAGLLAGNFSLVVGKYRREMEGKKTLEKLVSIDENTGLYKESEFFKKLDEEFLRARRYGTNFSVLLVQILNYDELHSIYGEIDVVNILKSISEHMCRELRFSDAKFAIGEDRLSILLAETDESGARKVVEKLHMTLERVTTTIHDGVKKVVRVKPSIGMASLSEGDRDSLEIYDRALNELTYDKG